MIAATGIKQTRTAVDQFAGVAALELATVTALIGVLEAERDALTRGDAEALPALIRNKTEHIAALSHFSTDRHRILEAAGIAIGAPEIRGFLGISQSALDGWEKLLAAARKAAGLNAANGFLTSTRLTSVSRALATLSVPQSGLYDPRGVNARNASSFRTLSRG